MRDQKGAKPRVERAFQVEKSTYESPESGQASSTEILKQAVAEQELGAEMQAERLTRWVQDF